MMKHWARGALLGAMAALVAGCQPSRESLTAGEIGCLPSELSTHEVGSSSGWNQSAETWTAECRGRRFICSQVTTSSRDISWIFTDGTDSVDSDISCHEELSSAEAASDSRAAPARLPVALARSAPPESGAGFAFGIDRAAAQSSCEAAGHAWQPGAGAHATCSGPASPLGFAATARLTFCAEALCRVTVTHTPESHWAESFSELDASLTSKYGAASRREARIPSMCRTGEQFDRCVLDGILTLKASWQWPDGQQLRLLVGRPSPHAGVAAVQLSYVRRRPGSGVNASAL